MTSPLDKKQDTTLASAFNLARFYPAGFKSGSFRNDEGRDIFYLKASPEGQSKGRVVVTPGYGDSVNFHYDAIRKWQERGFEVYAMDWIGQGVSDREDPARIQSPNDRLMIRHMLDLQKFVEEVVPSKGPGPLILSTHSMGGHIGMLHLKHFPGVFDAAVMGAPLLDLNTSILPRSVFKGIVKAANALGFDDNPLPNWRHLINRVTAASENIRNLTEHNPEDLSLSEQGQLRMRELLKDAEVGLPTWGFLRRIYPSLEEMRRDDYFDDINTPVLIVAAGMDELIRNKALAFAAKELPNGHLLEAPLSGHGVWNGTEKHKTLLWNGVDKFVETELGIKMERDTAPAAPQRGVPAMAQTPAQTPAWGAPALAMG